MHTNSWLIQEVEGVSLGVKGCRAAQEAAPGQKECCGRRASPPSCDLLDTLHEPKGRGEACGFVLVFF